MPQDRVVGVGVGDSDCCTTTTTASTTTGSTTILPSFPSLRQQNLRALYGVGGAVGDYQHHHHHGHDNDNDESATIYKMDKSRAGGVDPHIRDLVDCINRHESFVTLSSCSGRIALFDPTSNDEKMDRYRYDKVTTTTASGKGGSGCWLLVSHDVVDPSALLPFFSDDDEGDDDDGDDDDELEDNENTASNGSKDAFYSCHCCSFKFEPMLLHIAACNLERGQQLLQLALHTGFRESGLVVTDQRVTVAIRTQGLALTVPLSRQRRDPLRPTGTAYLRALVMEANRRLVANLERLHKLKAALERSALFFGHANCGIHDSNTKVSLSLSSQRQLPDLNLHGHAVVPVAATGVDDLMVLLVFGGYGAGPAASEAAPQQRSARVYALRRRNAIGGVCWEPEWQTVEILLASSTSTSSSSISQDNNNTAVVSLGRRHHNAYSYEIVVEPAAVSWDARQGGAAVCLWPVPSGMNEQQQQQQQQLSLIGSVNGNNNSIDCDALVLLFGGRKGPAKPLGDLLLFSYNSGTGTSCGGGGGGCCGRFLKPLDIRGTAPSPRWGHALTAMEERGTWDSSNPSPIALLTGGRNESDTNLDSLYLLSVIPMEEQRNDGTSVRYHFLWESVSDESSPLTLCRFHHTAVALDHDRFFVFGGLSSATDNLLEAFDAGAVDNEEEEGAGSSVLITLNRGRQLPATGSISAQFDTIQHDAEAIPSRFGHAACVLNATSLPGETCILFSGGVCTQSSGRQVAASEGRRDSSHSEFEPPQLQCVQLVSMAPSNNKQQQGPSWALVPRGVQWKLERRVDFGALVHHSCVRLPLHEVGGMDVVAVVGGGVSGFAFQECYASSHCLTLELDKGGTADDSRHSVAGSNSRLVPAEPRRGAQQQTPPPRLSSSIDSASTCEVVYVSKRNAKTLKTQLEELYFLDKRYRLTDPVDLGVARLFEKGTVLALSSCVAVPVSPVCIDLLLAKHESGDWGRLDQIPAWMRVVTGYGRQVCQQSTGTFARGQPSKRGSLHPSESSSR